MLCFYVDKVRIQMSSTGEVREELRQVKERLDLEIKLKQGFEEETKSLRKR